MFGLMLLVQFFCHERLLNLIRGLHKKDELLAAALVLRYPILWDGHPARPDIISRQDACTTRNFGIFFIWKSLNKNPLN